MKDQIIQCIDNPEMLELLYRKNKRRFAIDFGEATRGIESELVRFWRIRLQESEPTVQHAALKNGMGIAGIISVVLVLLMKVPMITASGFPENYYLRNLPILVFSGLTAWFIVKNGIRNLRQLLVLILPVLGLVIYLNLLPEKLNDATTLSIIHAPLFMFFIFALAFVAFDFRDAGKVSAMIRYGGELVIMTGLLAITGLLLSGMTIGLFLAIGKDIAEVYMEQVGVVGLAIIPILAAWLLDRYPDITRRIVPVIARIFTPLVFVVVVVYLVVLLTSGIRLSENRDFLIVFNLLLLAVMVIILFSLSELDKSHLRKQNIILLFLLVVATLIINVLALSAIIARLSDGFTPNRTVVLVSNILVMIHLLVALPGLFQAGFRGKSLGPVERIIYGYLPVYLVYSIAVIFLLPWIFR